MLKKKKNLKKLNQKLLQLKQKKKNQNHNLFRKQQLHQNCKDHQIKNNGTI
jgi:hypothetical protein